MVEEVVAETKMDQLQEQVVVAQVEVEMVEEMDQKLVVMLLLIQVVVVEETHVAHHQEHKVVVVQEVQELLL